jgi:hypothetical protein
MSSRQFTDSKGTKWRVWCTVPSPASLLSADYARGWLTFDSDAMRRRLAPIPRGWETAAEDRLELMCRAAEEVSIQTGPIPKLSKELMVEEASPDAATEAPVTPPPRPPAA